MNKQCICRQMKDGSGIHIFSNRQRPLIRCATERWWISELSLDMLEKFLSHSEVRTLSFCSFKTYLSRIESSNEMNLALIQQKNLHHPYLSALNPGIRLKIWKFNHKIDWQLFPHFYHIAQTSVSGRNW